MRCFHWFLLAWALLMPPRLVHAQNRVWQPAEWPVLKHYDQGHVARIALPLGGIGTGTVSLGRKRAVAGLGNHERAG